MFCLLFVLPILFTIALSDSGSTVSYPPSLHGRHLPQFVYIAMDEVPANQMGKVQTEYEELLKNEENMTEQERADVQLEWAQGRGAKVLAAYKEYADKIVNDKAKRYRVLNGRIDKAEGSDEAKQMLRDLLNMQQLTNLTLIQYEDMDRAIYKEYPVSVQEEASVVWNKIGPANWQR